MHLSKYLNMACSNLLYHARDEDKDDSVLTLSSESWNLGLRADDQGEQLEEDGCFGKSKKNMPDEVNEPTNGLAAQEEEIIVPNGLISETVLRNVSMLTYNDWKKLANCLGFSQHDIDTIVSGHHDNPERCYHMLTQWRVKEGKEASYEKLGQALLKCNRSDVNDYLESLEPNEVNVSTNGPAAWWKKCIDVLISEIFCGCVSMQKFDVWKQIALYLGLSLDDITAIEIGYHEHDDHKKFHLMLKMWRGTEGMKDSYKKLGRALLECFKSDDMPNELSKSLNILQMLVHTDI